MLAEQGTDHAGLRMNSTADCPNEPAWKDEVEEYSKKIGFSISCEFKNLDFSNEGDIRFSPINDY